MQIVLAVLSFVLLTFCKCFGPQARFTHGNDRDFCLPRPTLQLFWLTNTCEKTYYVLMVWLKFPTILKNVLYAHRTICPWNTVPRFCRSEPVCRLQRRLKYSSGPGEAPIWSRNRPDVSFRPNLTYRLDTLQAVWENPITFERRFFPKMRSR